MDVLSGEHMKPEFLSINAEHCVPVIVDHATGLTLSESHAILPYLVNQYAPGHDMYPSDAVVRAKVDKWLHFSNATLMPASRAANKPVFFGDGTAPADAMQALKYTINMMDTLLVRSGCMFLAADHVTIADLNPCLALEMTLALQSMDLSEWPLLSQWYERVQQTAIGYQEINAGVTGDYLLRLKAMFGKKQDDADDCKHAPDK